MSNALVSPTTTQRVGLSRLLLFCAIFFGLAVTEEVSINVLPLTLQKMTEGFLLQIHLPFSIPKLAPEGLLTIGSALVIGLVLALNPAFGFIAQPLVGVLSDRIWTRVGRRAFFLIIGSPVVALCLLSVPFATQLWQLILLVVVYQFFQDILWGSDHPLLADLFPSRQRGITVACLAFSYQIGAVLVTRVGLEWIDRYEAAHGDEHYGLPIYAAAAACQIVFVMILAFFLWERKYEGPPRTKMTPRSYVKDFVDQPGLARMGAFNFARAFMNASVVGFLVLFATTTLQLNKSDLAKAIGWLPLIALGAVFVAGWMADKFRRDYLLMGGIGICVLGYAIGAQSGTLVILALAFAVFKLGWAVVEVGFKSMITDFYPKEMIGQLAGAINITYATGRTTALVVVGAVVGAFGDNYRLTFYIAIAFGFIAFLILLTVRDPRGREDKPVEEKIDPMPRS